MKKTGLIAAAIVVIGLTLYLFTTRKNKSNGVTQNAYHPLSLDKMFEGIENGCARNQILTRALSSMASPLPDQVGWKPNSRLILPLQYARHFGAPQIDTEKSDFSLIRVKIEGATYHGFPVKELQQWMGHGNGVNGFSLSLSATPEAVESKLNSEFRIVDSCHNDPYCGEPFQIKISPHGEGTQLICDTSM